MRNIRSWWKNIPNGSTKEFPSQISQTKAVVMTKRSDAVTLSLPRIDEIVSFAIMKWLSQPYLSLVFLCYFSILLLPVFLGRISIEFMKEA